MQFLVALEIPWKRLPVSLWGGLICGFPQVTHGCPQQFASLTNTHPHPVASSLCVIPTMIRVSFDRWLVSIKTTNLSFSMFEKTKEMLSDALWHSENTYKMKNSAARGSKKHGIFSYRQIYLKKIWDSLKTSNRIEGKYFSFEGS